MSIVKSEVDKITKSHQMKLPNKTGWIWIRKIEPHFMRKQNNLINHLSTHEIAHQSTAAALQRWVAAEVIVVCTSNTISLGTRSLMHIMTEYV